MGSLYGRRLCSSLLPWPWHGRFYPSSKLTLAERDIPSSYLLPDLVKSISKLRQSSVQLLASSCYTILSPYGQSCNFGRILAIDNGFASTSRSKKVAGCGTRGESGTACDRKFHGNQIEAENIVKEKVDCLVIGAGVVGLAVARRLAMHGRSVVVVEAESSFGTATSSRNSEVIHAGIYYPPGSLKAVLCVEGRKLLYAFCKEYEVPHKQLGKLIVATSEQQMPVLQKLQKLGRQNGVGELYMLEGKVAMDMEPQLKCVKALYSPLTGILDSHAYMLALQESAKDLGVSFAFKTTAIAGHVTDNQIDVLVQSEGPRKEQVSEKLVLSSRVVVNCAGLLAQAFAKKLNGFPVKFIPKTCFAKGSYFSLSAGGRSPFSHLVYPIPEEGGIGVHLTLDLAGRIRFGPDVEWLSSEDVEANPFTRFDYTVNESRAECFYAVVRTYYPSLPDGCLVPDYSGIRPKLTGPGEKPADFVIQGKDSHGIPGLINLFGIESPGLTSSLAIAEFVHRKVCGP